MYCVCVCVCVCVCRCCTTTLCLWGKHEAVRRRRHHSCHRRVLSSGTRRAQPSRSRWDNMVKIYVCSYRLRGGGFCPGVHGFCLVTRQSCVCVCVCVCVWERERERERERARTNNSHDTPLLILLTAWVSEGIVFSELSCWILVKWACNCCLLSWWFPLLSPVYYYTHLHICPTPPCLTDPQHLSSNHRGHDLVIVDSSSVPTVMTAKFQYGPLAMASLSKEMVSTTMCMYMYVCAIIKLHLNL